MKNQGNYKGSPYQGLSEARRGRVVFASVPSPDPPRGRPVGGGGVHRKGDYKNRDQKGSTPFRETIKRVKTSTQRHYYVKNYQVSIFLMIPP